MDLYTSNKESLSAHICSLNFWAAREQTYLVSQDEIADIGSLVERAGREGAQAGALGLRSMNWPAPCLPDICRWYAVMEVSLDLMVNTINDSERRSESDVLRTLQCSTNPTIDPNTQPVSLLPPVAPSKCVYIFKSVTLKSSCESGGYESIMFFENVWALRPSRCCWCAHALLRTYL
jgi:hypothetical protein